MSGYFSSFYTGRFNYDTSWHRDGVRRRRRAIRADLQRRKVQRRRGWFRTLQKKLVSFLTNNNKFFCDLSRLDISSSSLSAVLVTAISW